MFESYSAERVEIMRTPEDDYEKELHVGNLFFKHKYASIDIKRAIENMDDFEDFEKFYTEELIDGNVLLKDYFGMLLKKYKTNARELFENTGYSEDYIRKIKNGGRDNPERDCLLAICVYLRATVEETQVLLRYAGEQPLYARRKRDAIIWYALKKKEGLVALDIHLDKYGYKMLTKPEKSEKQD